MNLSWVVLISKTPPPLRPRGLFVCRAGGKGITCVQVKDLEVCAFIIKGVFGKLWRWMPCAELPEEDRAVGGLL